MSTLSNIVSTLKATVLPLVVQFVFWAHSIYAAYVPAKLRHYVDVAGCALLTAARLGNGTFAYDLAKAARRPEKPLILYEFEGCPFCRKVREAMSILDLDVIVYPCPRVTIKQYGVVEGSRFRPKVMQLGGKAVFPFMVDENTNTQMYDSGEIIKYLFATYGGVQITERSVDALPWLFRQSQLANRLTLLSTFIRPMISMGTLRCPSKPAAEPLVLYGYEGNPFTRAIREALTCLELPYYLHNVPLRSAKRRTLDKSVPTLRDPNTGFQSDDSFTIVQYLYRQYKDGEFPNESMLDYTTKGATASHGTLPGTKRD